MKRLLILFLMVALVLPAIALADGGVVMPNYYDKVTLPEQKAVIVWDGEKENLILSTKIMPEEIKDMAWIIPIKSKTAPEVEGYNISLFYDVARLFVERNTDLSFGFSGKMSAQTESVQIVEVKIVDMYYIVVLKATDASVLVEWLNTHGLSMPTEAEEVLEDYVGDDYYFVVNKINLQSKLDAPPTEADYACAKSIRLSSSYYTYHDTMYDEMILNAFSSNSLCVGTSFEAVNMIKEIELGISTPLKIEFEPGEPYYPMKMSNINGGDVRIDVYFFGDDYVQDSSGYLKTQGRKENPEWLSSKYGIYRDKVTYLKYDGEVEFKKDSYFEKYGFFNGILEGLSKFFALFK